MLRQPSWTLRLAAPGRLACARTVPGGRLLQYAPSILPSVLQNCQLPPSASTSSTAIPQPPTPPNIIAAMQGPPRGNCMASQCCQSPRRIFLGVRNTIMTDREASHRPPPLNRRYQHMCSEDAAAMHTAVDFVSGIIAPQGPRGYRKGGPCHCCGSHHELCVWWPQGS